jgi:hypothetical protein
MGKLFFCIARQTVWLQNAWQKVPIQKVVNNKKSMGLAKKCLPG